MTADVYTGKHRREGALGPLAASGTPGTLSVPPQGKPAWSKAGRLLAAQIVVIAKEPYPGRVMPGAPLSGHDRSLQLKGVRQ